MQFDTIPTLTSETLANVIDGGFEGVIATRVSGKSSVLGALSLIADSGKSVDATIYLGIRLKKQFAPVTKAINNANTHPRLRVQGVIVTEDSERVNTKNIRYVKDRMSSQILCVEIGGAHVVITGTIPLQENRINHNQLSLLMVQRTDAAGVTALLAKFVGISDELSKGEKYAARGKALESNSGLGEVGKHQPPLTAKERKEVALADKAEIEAKKLKGEVVDRETVETNIVKIGAVLSGFLSSLPTEMQALTNNSNFADAIERKSTALLGELKDSLRGLASDAD